MLFRAIAPAKINLGLAIKAKREDGYHEIDTIMQSVSIYDVVEVRMTEDCSIRIECEKDLNCEDKDNIAYKAAEEFFRYTGIKNSGVIIEIEKNIPIYAGLAGGSSDGAAVIVCLNEMFNTELSTEEIKNIGEKVGADVPFCVSGGTARASGIGTQIDKIRDFPDCGIVIVKPDCNISTKEAYKMYDIYGSKSERSVEEMIYLINGQDLTGVASYLFNDFEQFVSDIRIDEAKKEILKYKPLGVCMSGSGPSVFGIFRSCDDAELCVNRLKKKYKNSYACKPITHGAQIL